MRLLVPGIVSILHDSLLNHMTIITKVGTSYVDHMNDDMPEVDSFSPGCYYALSPPLVIEANSAYAHNTLHFTPPTKSDKQL